MLKRLAFAFLALICAVGGWSPSAVAAPAQTVCSQGPYLPNGSLSVAYAWAYATKKVVQNYRGPLYKIRLINGSGPIATTNATKDIYPKLGCDEPDFRSIRAFTGGRPYNVVFFYDQAEVLGGWAAATNSNASDATSLFSAGTLGSPGYGNPTYLSRLPYGPRYRGVVYTGGSSPNTLADLDGVYNNTAMRGNFSVTSRLAVTRIFIASAGTLADVNSPGTLGSTTGRVALMFGDTWGQFHRLGAWVGTTGTAPTSRVTTSVAGLVPSNWPAMYIINQNGASSIRFCLNATCETVTTKVGGGAFSIPAGAYTISSQATNDAGSTPTPTYGMTELWADVGLNGAASAGDETLLQTWSQGAFNIPTYQPRVNVVFGGSSTPSGYKGIGTGVPASLAQMLGANARMTVYGNSGSNWSDVNGDSAAFFAAAKDASATYNIAVGYAGRNEINNTNTGGSCTSPPGFNTGASAAQFNACADLAVTGAGTFCDNAIAAGYDYCILGTLYDTNWGNNSTTTATDFSRAQAAAARYNDNTNGIQSTAFLTAGSRTGKVFIADTAGAIKDATGGTTNPRLNCWPTTITHIISGACNGTSQDSATMDNDQVHALLGGAQSVAAADYAAIPSAVRTAAQ